MTGWTDEVAAHLGDIRTLVAAREFGAARESLTALVIDHCDGITAQFDMMQQFVVTAFAAFDLPNAQRIIALHFGPLATCTLGFAPQDPLHTHLIRWEISPDGTQHFTFNEWLPNMAFNFIFMIVTRWVACLRLAMRYDATAHSTGRTYLDLGDWSSGLGLCFSDNRPDAMLIPDSSFLGSNGYEVARPWGGPGSAPWDQRQATAIWRGSSTGEGTGSLMEFPRVNLCRLALRPGAETILDAGITAVVQAQTPEDAERLRTSGLCKGHVSMPAHSNYKYQIDIDGNTNSWPGLFQKLLTGSPVLKVRSPKLYRQWYYPRMIPWLNYVPVATDMSDLLDIIDYLIRHDDLAHAIGIAGRQLAEDMTCAAEIARSLPTIEAAFNRGGFTAHPAEPVNFGP